METITDKKGRKPSSSGVRVPLICEDQLFLSIENRVRSRSARLMDTGVLPTVDIKQIEIFVPTNSSCSY